MMQSCPAKGDVAEVPRQVDHTAVFPSRDNAQAAVADLEAVGFTIGQMRPIGSASSCEFTRIGPVDLATVQATTRQLVGLIESHGGSCDE